VQRHQRRPSAYFYRRRPFGGREGEGEERGRREGEREGQERSTYFPPLGACCIISILWVGMVAMAVAAMAVAAMAVVVIVVAAMAVAAGGGGGGGGVSVTAGGRTGAGSRRR
jgi:hypothetical protein